MQEQFQLCDLQNIRVLIREVAELNELRARVLEAEARLRAKYTRAQSPGRHSTPASLRRAIPAPAPGSPEARNYPSPASLVPEMES